MSEGYGAPGGCWRRVMRPPGSWPRLASLGNTVGIIRDNIVFDHQAPLTRPLGAVATACSTLRRRWMQGDEHSPWVAEMKPPSKDFKNSWKIMIFIDF